jgi:amino acid permease
MFTKKDKRAKSQEARFSMRLSVLLLASCFFSLSVNAQCAMCRAALEGEGNIKKAEAVNDGIVYLMMIPYIMVGVVGFFVYRMFRKKKATV